MCMNGLTLGKCRGVEWVGLGCTCIGGIGWLIFCWPGATTEDGSQLCLLQHGDTYPYLSLSSQNRTYHCRKMEPIYIICWCGFHSLTRHRPEKTPRHPSILYQINGAVASPFDSMCGESAPGRNPYHTIYTIPYICVLVHYTLYFSHIHIYTYTHTYTYTNTN